MSSGDGSKAIGSAIDTAKRVKTLFTGAKQTSIADTKLLISEMMDQIADANIANATLKENLTLLHNELMQAQRKDEEFDRYELWETPAGFTVYKLKEASAKKEPIHYLCPTCKDRGEKSILQGGKTKHLCLKSTPELDSKFKVVLVANGGLL